MDDARKTQLTKHAWPFLACLLGCALDDAGEQFITFQTFTDPNPKPDPDPLAKVLHGSLEGRAEDLERLSQAGAGIFVSVNGTDGRARGKVNIVQLRGVHADLDFKDATTPFDVQAVLDSLPLEPTMVVRTPGGLHLYWLFLVAMPCKDKVRRDEHEAELKAIQQALAVFGADPKVCIVCGVLRVPGYLHQKAEPRMVELLKVNGPRYTREQIRAAFPPAPKVSEPEKAPIQAHGPIGCRPENWRERVADYLPTCEPSIQGQNGSGALFNVCLKLFTRFGLSVDEVVNQVMEHYNIEGVCVPLWSLAEVRHKAVDADKNADPDRGTLWREDRPVEPKAVRADRPKPSAAPPPGDDDAPQPEVDQGEPAGVPSDRPEVPGYEWRKRGLFQVHKASIAPSGDEIPPKPPMWLAPPFTLPGLVRDELSNGWCLLIAWCDLDGQYHEERAPLELLSGEGAELTRILAQGGLVPSPELAARKSLIRYLCRAHLLIRRRVRLVDSLGWNDGAFVLFTGETIGELGEAVRYSGDVPGTRCKATEGTLEGWQHGVARFAVGNPFLGFSIACAFAGPMLALLRPDGGGGFNHYGRSSQGKSTALVAGLSAWGNPLPLPTWRATGNGLEGIAAARNDGFLALDELSQVDAKEAGQVAYMLANGSAKARMTKEGGNRPLRQWKLIFLSNGEVTLEDKVTEDGKQPRARAGQEVRLADIPCPDSGLFPELHGFPGGGELAEHIKAQAGKHYGHAIRAFLRNLSEAWPRRVELVARLKAMESAWLAQALPSEVDGQVRRVALRFALVAVGGELAQSMGILPWAEGDAASAALVCFKAWLDRRGFTGASEVYRGIAAVVAFLERNGQARFDEWGDATAEEKVDINGKPLPRPPRIINRAGTRKRSEEMDGWDFYLTAEGWAEATRGFNAAGVARACYEAGILEAGSKGKHSKPVSIPGHGKTRCYVIRAAALFKFHETEAA